MKHNAHYQHFSILSQPLVDFIIIIAKIHPDIRSCTIQYYLCHHRKGAIVTISWLNQIIRREDIPRPQGRPPKEYTENVPHYLEYIETVSKRYTEHLGIMVMQSMCHGFEIYKQFTTILKCDRSGALPRKESSIVNFLKTLNAIALTPGVKNFEEAQNADIAHTGMSIHSARNAIKGLEEIDNLEAKVGTMFSDFWICFLDRVRQHHPILYADGHVKPYFSKENHVCGVMSVSGRVMPGTKYVLATNGNGYILAIACCRVNEHYNDAIQGMLRNPLKNHIDAVDLLILDREGCGKDFNKLLGDDLKIAVLTPLRTNQYKGLCDFSCTELKENLYVGSWKDEQKKSEDPRTFVIIDYGARQCVFQISTSRFDYENVPRLYKTRWPMNEEIIKNLNMQTDFNVNVCNGTHTIIDPAHKTRVEKIDAQIQMEEKKMIAYGERLENSICPSEKKHRQEQMEKAEQRKAAFEKTKQKAGEGERKKIRNTAPDYFMAAFKASILNLYRYFLKVCLPQYKNPPMEKFYQLFLNRRGAYWSTQTEDIYEFERPSRSADRELLEEFCKNFTKMKNKGENGRLVVLKVSEGPP